MCSMYVLQRGCEVLWELVVWASTALTHQWGRMGHHSSGYIFQSHHSSCDKINLIRSFLIFLSMLTTGNTAQSPPRNVWGYLVKSGEIWHWGLHLILLGLKNPLGSGWCFTSKLFFPILISFCRLSYFYSHLLYPSLASFCQQDLLGRASWISCLLHHLSGNQC